MYFCKILTLYDLITYEQLGYKANVAQTTINFPASKFNIFRWNSSITGREN